MVSYIMLSHLYIAKIIADTFSPLCLLWCLHLALGVLLLNRVRFIRSIDVFGVWGLGSIDGEMDESSILVPVRR